MTKTELRASITEVFSENETGGLSAKDSSDLIDNLVDRIALDAGILDDEDDSDEEEE